MQPTCRAFEVLDDGERLELPRCAETSGGDCFAVTQSPACSHTDTGLALDTSRAGALAETGHHIQIECVR